MGSCKPETGKECKRLIDQIAKDLEHVKQKQTNKDQELARCQCLV